MCWYSNEIPIRHIAEEDIICYKIFLNKDIFFTRSSFLGFKCGERKIKKLSSLFRDFKYIPYQKPEDINIYIGYDEYTLCYRIYKGYHSFATLDRAKYEWEDIQDTSIIECIIPKGAEYFINKYNLIVSSTIIVTDKIVYPK